MAEKLERALIQISLKSNNDKQRVSQQLSQFTLPSGNNALPSESQIEVDVLTTAADADLQMTLIKVLETDLNELVLPFVRGLAGVKDVSLISVKRSSKSAEQAEKELADQKIRYATLSFDVPEDQAESVLQRAKDVQSDMEIHIENYRGIMELLFGIESQPEIEEARPVKPGHTRVFIHLYGEFTKGAVERLRSTEFNAQEFPQIEDHHLDIVQLFSQEKPKK